MGDGIRLLKTKAQVREFVAQARSRGEMIGLVPTMGAIHQGHQSLVQRAIEHGADTVVASVFVNPTQFSPTEDFDAYPRTLDADLAAMEEAGAAAVFAPSVAEMYGEALVESMRVHGLTSFGFLSHAVAGSAARLWEGERRPTHFDGVTMVVSKLFNIVEPDVACFGEKDFQQLAVLRQMVADMDFGLEIVGCPIVRDEDGLAVSSRNRYMDAAQHERALALSRSLREAREAFASGQRDVGIIVAGIRATLEAQNLDIDYAEIVDAATLEPLDSLDGINGADTRVILAARVDDTVRLIDNASLA